MKKKSWVSKKTRLSVRKMNVFWITGGKRGEAEAFMDGKEITLSWRQRIRQKQTGLEVNGLTDLMNVPVL